MGCCTCCCPEGEECCKAPGSGGICCDPEKCCGTEEEPVCCPSGEKCCGEICIPEAEPCGECEGCPDPDECTLVVYADFDEPTGRVEYYRDLVTYSEPETGPCKVEVNIGDLPAEACGNIEGQVFLGYTAGCECPKIVDVQGFCGALFGSDPDCEPLPLAFEIADCAGDCGGSQVYDGASCPEANDDPP
jgi:hypothetical protein